MNGIRFFLLSLCGMVMLLAAGCATTNDSDLPWNTPQPWEGSPAIPGLSTMGSEY